MDNQPGLSNHSVGLPGVRRKSLHSWAVILYNIWVLESIDLHHQKGIPESYVCCEGNSITKPRVKKIPREPHERPRRPWAPRSIQKLYHFLGVVKVIVIRSLQDLIQVPEDNNFELLESYWEKLKYYCLRYQRKLVLYKSWEVLHRDFCQFSNYQFAFNQLKARKIKYLLET